jgi:uncharacterized repeat protein (TIGR01451 family)
MDEGQDLMKKSRELLAGLVLLAALATLALAVTYDSNGNPGDTPYQTAITALSTQETLSCKDLSGSQMSTVEPSSGDETHVASPEYGYSGPGSPSDLSVSPGDIVYHYYRVTNEGNANDPNYKGIFYYDHYAGASGWTVELWLGGAFNTTLEAGATSEVTGTFNDNSDSAFDYKVMVSSEASGAPNGSYIIIVSTVETTSTPTTKYQGANNYYYSGWASAMDSVTDQVSAPILTLTRTSTVDAPAVYTGDHHDAVPGAVITFTMNYSNDGGASAESVVLVDRIPANTKLAHVNTTGSTTNVNITAASGNATGWTVYYNAVDDSPNKTYGNYTNWVLIGSLEAGTEDFPGGGTTYVSVDAPYNAKWIKWEKQVNGVKGYIDSAEDNKTLTWGATIR